MDNDGAPRIIPRSVPRSVRAIGGVGVARLIDGPVAVVRDERGVQPGQDQRIRFLKLGPLGSDAWLG